MTGVVVNDIVMRELKIVGAKYAAAMDDDIKDFIYRHKTADLFIAAAVMGAYAGGGTEADVARLREYALNLGLAFQYEDDLLDGDAGISPEEAKRRITDHTAAALASLEGLPGDTAFLSALAQRLAGRTA